MSAILTARGLAAGHADRLLFSGLDLVIAPGEITGLVGANGAGKSTLLRILAGLVPPDQGEVGLSPPDATVGYLAQEPERRPGESTGGFIARRTGVARAEQDLDEATALLVQQKPGSDDAYATALVAFATEQAGVPASQAGLSKALAWLRAHQDPQGGFWTAESMNHKHSHYGAMAEKFMSDAATGYATAALLAAGDDGIQRTASSSKPRN